MKGWIKNVMNFKKPFSWIIVVLIVIVTIWIVGLAVNRAAEKPNAHLIFETDKLKRSDIDNIKVGDSVDHVHETLGEPSGQLSGFWGDIYVLEPGKKAIIYYDSKGTVEQVKLSIDEN